MTEVTDKMVEVVDVGTLKNDLLGCYGLDGESLWRSGNARAKAVDVIEELVETLRKYADDEYNGYNKDGAHARAILTKMGVELRS